MLKKNKSFSVFSLYRDVVISKDYENPTSVDMLRTMLGNEASILSWTSLENADRRFMSLVMPLRVENAPYHPTDHRQPSLRLVVS